MQERRYTDSVAENHRRAIADVADGASYGMWIDGERTDAAGGETFETSDPAVDVPITEVPRGTPADVDAAVDAAVDAFERDWGTRSPAERSELLREWIAEIRAHREELALLESLDTGKPLSSARGEVDRAVEFLDYYASVIRADQGSEIPTGGDSHVFVQKEPYGVAGLILPWNYPLVLASWKLGPALAAGNTVVAKPAEDSPLSLVRVAQLASGILPDGVFNVVHGFGSEVGSALTGHPDVDKLSFTGEDATGELVMRAAATQITPVTLELGGKSPFVVFADADVPKVARVVADSIFYNTGQSCNACSRVLVHEDVRDEFVDRFAAEAERYRPGDPLRDGTTLGPLTSEQQYDRVTGYVETGLSEGASLLFGGGSPDSESLRDGWFVHPTAFTDVTNDMTIAREEIFGPVQTILEFSTYDEAIELANDTEFGLAAGVGTESLKLAHRAAQDLDAGSIWVNKYGSTPPGGSFGGYKRSGIGRECGLDALDHYTQRKTVNIDLAD